MVGGQAGSVKPVSIIMRMSAIRKLAVAATDNGLLTPELAAGGDYDSGAGDLGTGFTCPISFASVQIQNVVQSEQKQGGRDSVKENRVNP